MRRETVNLLRGVAEDWLPPVLRDSALFRFAARAAFGKCVDEYATLREQAAVWQDSDWRDFYGAQKRGQARRGSDNSEATVQRIIADIAPDSVVDVGCGTGDLLQRIRAARPELTPLRGVDLRIPDSTRQRLNVEWTEASATQLPMADASYDTVVCTHTLEHLPDLPAAVAELRRVARRRLIVVVPRERPYRWTINAHVHFFAYSHQLSLAMRPRSPFRCETIGRDLYYCEDIA